MVEAGTRDRIPGRGAVDGDGPAARQARRCPGRGKDVRDRARGAEQRARLGRDTGEAREIDVGRGAHEGRGVGQILRLERAVEGKADRRAHAPEHAHERHVHGIGWAKGHQDQIERLRLCADDIEDLVRLLGQGRLAEAVAVEHHAQGARHGPVRLDEQQTRGGAPRKRTGGTCRRRRVVLVQSGLSLRRHDPDQVQRVAARRQR